MERKREKESRRYKYRARSTETEMKREKITTSWKSEYEMNFLFKSSDLKVYLLTYLIDFISE